ncbi:MAG TPA: GPR endopeptidase [Clostridiales bacterium]|nr:GPR endopeptidase [Clostridiales bacterium]
MFLGNGAVRTDLVLEAREMYEKDAGLQGSSEVVTPPGVEAAEESDGPVKTTRIKVVTPEGERNTGKPMGSYITVECPGLHRLDKQTHEKVCSIVARELASLLKIKQNGTVLVAGLGNWNVTPDALGPKVTSTMLVTRHLLQYLPQDIASGIRPVSAISPGVLGITGIETGEIIKGVVDKTLPDAVILVDALASRRIDRIGATIQLADTGIAPGSGVGNKRMELSRQSLGIPVVAIGVPTVVDAATMANDIIDIVAEALHQQAGGDQNLYGMLKTMDNEDRYRVIRESMQPWARDLVVTPKEVDEIIDTLSRILANSINMALHQSISVQQLDHFLH